MLNIIRADLYRILRSKGFYITVILFFAFIILQTAASSKGGVIVMESTTITTDEEGNIIYSNIPEPFTGNTAPFEMMDNTDTLLYFILPFIIFIAATDFSSDAVKNVLSNGMPRVKYYLSKLVLSCVFCFFILLAQIIVSIVTATILRGFGGAFDMEFIGRLLRPFLAQLFMCIAVTCVGVFFVFVTKRTAAVNGAYIAFCILPVLIMVAFAMLNDKISFLLGYDIIMNIRMLAGIDTVSSIDILRAFGIGGFYILASTVGGIAIFNRSEVK